MIMKTRILVASAAIVLAVISAPAFASTVDFSFSFTNTSNGRTGVVIGIVRGLTDNATEPATSFHITSNTEGFGVGEYNVGQNNSWELSGGVITAFQFKSLGLFNTSPGVTCCSVHLESTGEGPLAGLTGSGRIVRSDLSDLGFTPLSAVPVPAAVWLFGTALVGLIGFGKRKSRITA